MSIGAFGFRVFTITGLAGCTFTSLYLICATGIKQNSYDFFGGRTRWLAKGGTLCSLAR
jgi:thioredoxin reductase